MFPSEILNVDDPCFKYVTDLWRESILKVLRYIPTRGAGRPRYNPVNMLKTIIYGFAEKKDIALFENLKIIAELTSDICT